MIGNDFKVQSPKLSDALPDRWLIKYFWPKSECQREHKPHDKSERRQTERVRERQRQRQTDRQTDRQRQRQRGWFDPAFAYIKMFLPFVHCCFKSTQTIKRTIRDGKPRALPSTFVQLLSSKV